MRKYISQERCWRTSIQKSEQTAVTSDGSNRHHNVSGHVLNVVSQVVQEDIWEHGFEWF
mgnify:CR=1 FL=1